MNFKSIFFLIYALLGTTILFAQNNDSLKIKELKTVVVSGKSSKYKSDSTDLLMRIPLKIMEIPQQVQVVSRAILNDQGANTVNDVYKNSSGVVSTGGTAYTGALIRGFQIDYKNFLYNGQRGGIGNQISVPFLPHVEDIEIFKGASGILYGEGGIGGTININTKKPLDYQRYEIGFTTASFNTYRIQFDVSAPLSTNKNLAFRISGGYEDAKSFTKFFYNKTFIIAPSLIYKPFPGTSIEWNATYMNDKRNVGWQNGVPAIGTNTLYLPRDFTLNDPSDKASQNNFQSQIILKQKISNNLKLNVLYNYSDDSWIGAYWIASFKSVNSAGNLKRLWEQNAQNVHYLFNSLNSFLTYTIDKGKWKNSFVLGYDFNETQEKYPALRDVSVSTPFNVFNPVYNQINPDTIQGAYSASLYKYSANSGYIQYLLRWNEKLNVLVGARYESYTFNQDTLNTNSFLPRIGISYAFNKKYTVFAGYNEGITPNSPNNPINGGPFPSQRGKQIEFGGKANLLKDRLLASLSFYKINNTNILSPDLTDSTGNKQKPVGEAESKGIELDITGNISENLQVIGNYAYNDLKITKSTISSTIGQRYANWIPNIANLWTVYSFNRWLKGVNLGLGLNYSDKRFITYNDQGIGVSAPSYLLLNAKIGYVFKGFELNINLNNITNQDYINGNPFGALNYVFRGAPSNFALNLKYKFAKAHVL